MRISIYWDDEDGGGWCARRVEKEDGRPVVGGEDTTRLDAQVSTAARREAAEYYGVAVDAVEIEES